MARMAQSVPRPDRTQVSFADNVVKLVIAVFVVPAPFEIVVGIIKKEQYDFTRLGIIVGALLVLAVVVALLRGRHVRLQSIVGYYLGIAGLILAVFGFTVTFRPDLVVRGGPVVETAISALAPTLGLLLLASGGYLVREQRKRAAEELDFPGPHNVASPRTVRVGDSTVSLWKSDIFTEHPGAQTVVDLCLPYLNIADLHYIAYYSPGGECVFYVDCLDDDGMSRYDVRDTPERRRQYERQGRTIRHVASRLDRRLVVLNSGPIVRLVVDIKKGALFLYILESEGFLIGATLDQRQVDPADNKLSDLANKILVARGGMGTQDFYRQPAS